MKVSAMEKPIQEILGAPPAVAWEQLCESLWEIFSAPLPESGANKEIVRRDRDLTESENLLAGSAWNLWNDFAASVKLGSAGVIEFWNEQNASGVLGKAVLILDGLSLREIPFILQEAQKRQFRIKRTGVWGAEIPATTTPYAKALGFTQRSSLENNQASSKRLPGAWTETCDLPFRDCAEQLPPERSIIFWHHRPDSRMHSLGSVGTGPEVLAKETEKMLTSDDFWLFIERLTTGRTLLITSDHGYAATGHFHDVQDATQAKSLAARYKAQRYAEQPENAKPLPWMPPGDWALTSPHGNFGLVLGRRKWRCPGGYPTLQHGGLSLLEMFVPFVEIEK